MGKENSGIRFPGFTFQYPSTGYATLSLFLVCSFLGASIYIILVKADPDNLQHVSGLMFRSYRSDGQRTKDLPPKRQFQFMTPSEKTWASRARSKAFTMLEPKAKTEFEQAHDWERKTDSVRVERFAETLLSSGLSNGFRRFDYIGEGTHGRDVGLWWVVTTDQCVDVDRFITFYNNYWNPPNGMYIEVMDMSSDTDRH